MGAPTPKQYLPLKGRSLIEWSLASLLACGWIDGVVVVLARSDSTFATLPVAGHPKIFTTLGGAARADSVLAGLTALAPRALAGAATRVLVHDAARPGLTARLLEQLREGDDAAHGALLALPCSDTLKRAEEGARVAETVERRHYWRAQTPQLFGLAQLTQALEQARAQGFEVTDEASAIEQLGHKPRLVRGQERNLKVTYPEDLALAAFWLNQEMP